MDDGTVVRADIFLPLEEGKYPVILSYGPYAKGLLFQEGYPDQWNRMVDQHPDVAANSTNRYQSWEVVDPEKWCPDGYACVRVDSRGAGSSPGFIEPWSPRETKDFAACIEWSGTQPWSNGKVGLNGISYYAMNQWMVATLEQPKHLAAMCAWEGASDFYREFAYHGGILSTFLANWFDMQVKTVQYGLGERGARSSVTGEPACGDVTLSDAELAKNRMRSRAATCSRIRWPTSITKLARRFGKNSKSRSCPREIGAVKVCICAATPKPSCARLRNRSGSSCTASSTGRISTPIMAVRCRSASSTTSSKGSRTDGTASAASISTCVISTTSKDATKTSGRSRARSGRSSISIPTARRSRKSRRKPAVTFRYSGFGDGLTFVTEPLDEPIEITGPSAAKLWLSSSTNDADVFVVLRAFAPSGDEVVFQGAIDPHAPLSQGWLRASHRKLDPKLSREYRPFHTHDKEEPLKPGEPVELDVEVWPTSIVLPRGYRLAVSVRGKDYVYPGGSGGRIKSFKNELTGCGPFIHDDPRNRPPEIFGGKNTVHISPDNPHIFCSLSYPLGAICSRLSS